MNILYEAIKPYAKVASTCCCDKITTRNQMCKNIEYILIYNKGLPHFDTLLNDALENLKVDNLIKDYNIVNDATSDNYIVMLKFSISMFDSIFMISFPKVLPLQEKDKYLFELDSINKNYLYENNIL